MYLLSERIIRFFPIIFLIALIIMSGIRAPVYEVSPWPHFLLMGGFFWSLYLPTILTKILLLCLGMLFDVVNGLPVGVSAIALLLMRWMVDSQHRFLLKEPFWVVWLAFTLMAISVMLVNYLLIMIVLGKMFLDTHSIVMLLLSVAWYPLFHRVCMSLYFDKLQLIIQREG